MRKTGIFTGLMAASTVGLATFALAAAADPAAHASACKLGKEAAGCKLDGTGYFSPSTRLIVGFPSSAGPKGSATQLSVPASLVCAGGGEAILVAETKTAARIGGSLSFAHKAKVQQATQGGAVGVASWSVTAKLKLTNAKTASLSGKANLTLTNGTKCSKSLSMKLQRVLGG